MRGVVSEMSSTYLGMKKYKKWRCLYSRTHVSVFKVSPRIEPLILGWLGSEVKEETFDHANIGLYSLEREREISLVSTSKNLTLSALGLRKIATKNNIGKPES